MEENKVSMNPPVEGITLDIVLRHPDAKVPSKAHDTDNGYDIYAVDWEYDEEIDCYIYHTGISVKVPLGYSFDVIPKSRHRKKNCYLPNTPGDVDPGYTGEITVSYKPRIPKCIRLVFNKILELMVKFNIETHRNSTTLNKLMRKESIPPYGAGEAVAQCYLTPHPDIKFNVVDKLPETERGEGGHGSTQINNH